jgi:hypothetical protein
MENWNIGILGKKIIEPRITGIPHFWDLRVNMFVFPCFFHHPIIPLLQYSNELTEEVDKWQD